MIFEFAIRALAGQFDMLAPFTLDPVALAFACAFLTGLDPVSCPPAMPRVGSRPER
ncbi:hypothetical protein PWG15_21210 (plasmid) [Ensifer adhaerens]|uniref:hypothetical protein n=1 Tax=Ensifer adhaerens TaxID=106592 RepID=UPI0023A9FB5E|nr:hypothetical protein [Ensifer adhaerens]WDZ80316.1 hypothetical protein PWG15_21210 [Ensifer adhaerens]